MAPAAVPQLESARLVLRPWRASDVAGYAPILADPEVMRFMGSGRRYAVKRAAARVVARFSDLEARRAIAKLVRHWELHGYGEWAIEERDGGELVGRVGFVRHPDWPAGPTKIEIGWTLARRAWGRGYATEAARVALDHGFGAFGLERVISIAHLGNVRSQRVMERLAMRRQGTARWRGGEMVWYAIDAADWPRAESQPDRAVAARAAR